LFNAPMTNFYKIATWADRKHVYAVVETPRGSRAKLEFKPQLKAFTLSKPLLAGLTYPYDWGFVPSTRAEDGDPIDALIIHDAATYPGLVLKCKPIGVLEIAQITKKSRERNDRIFLIPEQTDIESELTDVRKLSKQAKQDLKKFFEATDALESKKLKFLGWGGPVAATKLINEASC
jgi:inorganic pyrophosphatase